MSPAELIIDSFAGGGGASLGIELALGRSPDVAINHDAEAIALHAANHPTSTHYAEDVWQVDPLEATGGRPVGLMWLSPDCKHFSKAKGGKPVSKRVRGLAWVAVRWAVAVRPRVICLENVEEFQTWGPVLRDTGRPCPERKGATFRRFIGRLRRLGYAVEWRELRACDYGAPTSRKRLFLVARCDGEPIVWPTPTHGKGRPLPWRTAAECIDWTLPCPSIFLTPAEAKAIGVKRPLADATLRRIARGVQRYVIDSPRPFIVTMRGREDTHINASARPIAEPFRTITSDPAMALVAPYLAPITHQGDERAHAVDEPMRTVTAAKRGEFALVEPFLVPMQHDNRPTSLDEPLQTVTTQGNKFNLVAPVLVPRYGEREGQEPRAIAADRPMPTVVPTQNGASLVAAFLAKHYTGVVGAQPELPMPTVTAIDHHAVVASSLVSLHGSDPSHLHGDSLDEPLRTIAAGGTHAAEVRAFLTTYYGNEKGDAGGDLFAPARTVTATDRLGLVMVHGVAYQIADIGMRMLAPRELYRAQGFPDSYRIDVAFRGKPLTKTAQVRMCGNSVAPPVAAAIVAANLGAGGERMGDATRAAA